MEGIGYYHNEAILEFLLDLVSNGFLTEEDCCYLTVQWELIFIPTEHTTYART